MTRQKTGLCLGVVSSLLLGCGNDGNSPMSDPDQERPKTLVGHADDATNLPEGVLLHKSRDPNAPARVERVPVVIDDPAEISRTKEIFESGVAEIYNQALSRIADGEWVFSEHTHAMKLLQERAVEDLRKMTANKSLSPLARAKAAEKLSALNDDSGEDFLFELLQSEESDLRLSALESLREWDVDVDFSSLDRSNLVLSLLGDSDERVVVAAAKLCTYQSIAGTEARLTELLEGSTLKNPGAVASELADIASTRRAVDALLPHVLNDTADEFVQGMGYTFRKLIEHPDPNVAEPVRKALYEYTLRFPKQRYDQILVDHLAKSASHDAIPVLEDILNNATDTVSRTYAVEALARLQPEKAMQILVEHIQKEGARSDVIRLVRKHATQDDYDQVAPVLVEWSEITGRPFDVEIVRLFLVELGDRGEQFVRNRKNNLTDDARMWASWKLEELNLVDALIELHAAGVIQSKPNELIQKMQESRNRREEDDPLDISDPDSLVAALAWEGIVVMFDAETGTIPCDHDRLILQFADASAGKFAPQWPIQLWHQESEDDFDGPYTVQFVLNGRLYCTGAENYGDWYDVDAIARLINFSLETEGQSQRFITLDSNGQIASFVFAEPKSFLPIAQKYRLPLSDDASKAMREGIEFEKRVIDQSN